MTKTVFEIMTQLENTSGKLAKEQILRNNEDNQEFRNALVFLLNPYIVTGISTKKMNKEVKLGASLEYHPLDSLEHVITYLSLHNTGRDIDVSLIKTYIETLGTEEEKTFVKKLVTKDLKLGISESTVNKVYGKDTIPSFKVMLAESFAKKEEKVTGKFFITLKLDGNRCVAMKENGVTKFFSRKGQEIEGMSQLQEEFKNFPDGLVYDGELLLENVEELASDVLFRATQKVVRKDGEKKGLQFFMFDSLPIEEFKAGKSKKTYEQRRNTLELLFGKKEDLKLIELLPVLYEGTDKSQIPLLMAVVEEGGFEGLMINTASGLYVNKRSNDLLKVKTFKSADLLVMSVEKAIDGQFKGLLSRVNVEYKGNLVGCGSGFTLEQRREFIENPELITGKIIEIQFFEESQDDKTKQLSLRFPTFKGIRHDKGVEDINYGE